MNMSQQWITQRNEAVARGKLPALGHVHCARG